MALSAPLLSPLPHFHQPDMVEGYFCRVPWDIVRGDDWCRRYGMEGEVIYMEGVVGKFGGNIAGVFRKKLRENRVVVVIRLAE